MPVSLCDWRVRIGRFIPRQPAKSDECCHGTKTKKRCREREKERKKKKEKKKKMKKKKKRKKTLREKEKNKQRRWALRHYKKKRAREKAQKEMKRRRARSEKQIKETNDELPKKTQHPKKGTLPTGQHLGQLETCPGVAPEGIAVNTQRTKIDQAEDSFYSSTQMNNQTYIINEGPVEPRTSIDESEKPTSESCSGGCYSAIVHRCRNLFRRLISQPKQKTPPHGLHEKCTSGSKRSSKHLWKRFVTKLHLIRSGDIETNPGPKATSKNE